MNGDTARVENLEIENIRSDARLDMPPLLVLDRSYFTELPNPFRNLCDMSHRRESGRRADNRMG